MKSDLKFPFYLLLIFIATACGTNAKRNQFTDPELVAVYQAADERNISETLNFLKNPNPRIRAKASLLAGSVQDTSLLKRLYINLQDNEEEVATASAFAIGQCGTSADVAYLISWGRTEPRSEVLKEIIIAAGKLFDPTRNTKSVERTINNFIFDVQENDFLDLLMNMSTNDEQLQLGLGYGAFYLHRKGIFDEQLMKRIRFALQTSSPESRPVLALALSTYEGAWFDDNASYFNQWSKTEKNSDVKVYILASMGKLSDSESLDYLYAMAASQQFDHRLNFTAIRSLKKRKALDWSQWKKILAHQDEQVVSEAIRAYSAHFTQTNITELVSSVSINSSMVDALVLGQQLRLNAIEENKIVEKIEAAPNDYEKAFFIEALANGKNSKYLTELLASTSSPILRTSCTNAIINQYINGNAPQAEFLATLLKGLSMDDTGVVSTIATFMADSEIQTSSEDWKTTIAKTKSKLVLPRDIECYNELIRLENKLFSLNQEPSKPQSTSKIDWEYVSALPAFVQVEWETSKGVFTTELNTLEAPGSVSMILKLVEEGFYNNKAFHRVVPNFVTQGGCPIGNGMGGLDQPIRSEFTKLRYRRGTIGLASAGKDTESCQFFVTHSLVPTLDGRYTIIGEVTMGMDIVDQLVVGDKIITVKIVEAKN